MGFVRCLCVSVPASCVCVVVSNPRKPLEAVSGICAIPPSRTLHSPVSVCRMCACVRVHLRVCVYVRVCATVRVRLRVCVCAYVCLGV